MKSEPKTLYATVTQLIATNFEKYEHVDFSRCLTESMRFDVYWSIYQLISNPAYTEKRRLKRALGRDLFKPNVFFSLLNVGHRRQELLKMFHSFVDNISTRNSDCCDVGLTMIDLLIMDCIDSFRRVSQLPRHEQNRVVASAVNFSCFLIDGGWYSNAEKILRRLDNLSNSDLVETEIRLRLLHVLSAYSMFPEAETVYHQLLQSISTWFQCSSSEVEDEGFVEKYRHRHRSMSTSSSTMLTDDDESDVSSQRSSRMSLHECCPNLSPVYCEFSSYFFVRSQYQKAFDWGMKAVRSLQLDHCPKIIIDVLRQASKASVVRRQFSRAEILIQEAVLIARETYGTQHLKYADCLVDYGFYLLNVDSVAKSVQAYETALEIREQCLGSNNLLVALSYEELAYATYVHEYSTGHFDDACDYAEKSLQIMEDLLPNNHLLLSSSMRVLALILEEIAIDLSVSNDTKSKTLLRRAEDLHLSALSLVVAAFGEMNVQTAKHYGNLGRLYQTMERYTEAESMHLKAIDIKEKILGKDDYEVALSIGHLASLYNYDLNQFSKAEELYLRSIDIGLKLFGPGYSGLEYDYRGLIRVYQETRDWANFVRYQEKLSSWRTLREERSGDQLTSQHSLISPNMTSRPLMSVIKSVSDCSASQMEVEF